MPKTVIRKTEALCRTFLWFGTDKITRKSPIAWKKVCSPKRHGGLNIIYIENWNKAYLIKLQWNMHGKSDSMWIKWIHCYYVKKQDILTMVVRNNYSWILKSIMKIRHTTITNPRLDGNMQEVSWRKPKISKPEKCMMRLLEICKRSVGGECSIIMLICLVPSSHCRWHAIGNLLPKKD